MNSFNEDVTIFPNWPFDGSSTTQAEEHIPQCRIFNEERLKGAHKTTSISYNSNDVSDRGVSIRIPSYKLRYDWTGCFKYRRLASNTQPVKFNFF